MNFEILCSDLLSSNPKIRFAGILNSKGSLIAHKSRPDSSSLLTDDEVNMSVHYTYESWNRLQNLQHRLGKVKETVTKYENVTTITLIFENNLFLISTEPNSNSSKIVSDLWGLVDKKQSKRKPTKKTAKKRPTKKPAIKKIPKRSSKRSMSK